MQHCWVSWTSVLYRIGLPRLHVMIVRLFGVFIGCMTKPIFFLFHADLSVYQKFLKSFSLRQKNIVIIPAILNLAQEQPQ